jgi:Leucine-rich repeat (LRR) protein
MVSWKYQEYKNWIEVGCPLDISVSKLDLSHQNLTELSLFITNLPSLTFLNLSHNKFNENISIESFKFLSYLELSHNSFKEFPVLNCKNIKIINLSNNQITSIPPEIGNCINLYIFDISSNQLTSIHPEIGNCINLKNLNLSNNQLVSIPPEIGNCINLEYFYCCTNQLTSIPPEIGNCINLKHIVISVNQITTIPPEIGNCINLEYFFLDSNLITTIPPEIGMIRTMCIFMISNNPIEYLPPNIVRIVENNQNIYKDEQSVHNSHIQKSIKKSILRLISSPPIITSENIIDAIISDSILTDFTKESLVEYSSEPDLIVELNLSFFDVLVAVWNRISINEHSVEIKKVLNQEMEDSKCMCFTGRVSRLVNCLSTFDEFVEVVISDGEQIGNVIKVIEYNLKREKRYTVELHREIAKVELIERGYKEDVIVEWINFIN